MFTKWLQRVDKVDMITENSKEAKKLCVMWNTHKVLCAKIFIDSPLIHDKNSHWTAGHFVS